MRVHVTNQNGVQPFGFLINSKSDSVSPSRVTRASPLPAKLHSTERRALTQLTKPRGPRSQTVDEIEKQKNFQPQGETNRATSAAVTDEKGKVRIPCATGDHEQTRHACATNGGGLTRHHTLTLVAQVGRCCQLSFDYDDTWATPYRIRVLPGHF